MDAQFPAGMVEEIKAFLAKDSEREPGLDYYPEVFSTNFFFPLQRQQELARMMRVARTISPQLVMEIGTDKGGGLYHWIKCLPTVKSVIACEIRGTPYNNVFCDTYPTLNFLFIPWSSQDKGLIPIIERFLPLRKGKKIDVLFIDGDKTKFVEDFDTYLPLMNPNGIVLMHDITDGEPGAAFRTIAARGYLTEEIIDRYDTRKALKRADLGYPASCPHEAWLRHWAGRSCGVGVIYLGEK